MKVSDLIGNDTKVFTRGSPDRKPRISIVTPTYRRNAEGLLLDCLRSGLDQSFTDFEHIIIDDGSSDGTEDVVRRLSEEDDRIVYVRHDRNCGLPAVRTNEGIVRARGQAVAFLFDDNVLQPNFLEAAWPILSAGGVDVVHGEVSLPVTTGNPFLLGGWPLTLDLMRSLNTIANGGVLIRRDFFERFGLYDPHLVARRLCDWELWVRALWLGARFRHLPYLVAEERGLVSPNSLGNTIGIDWKVAYGYIQDTRSYADRARRLRPATFANEDVLDPARIRPYVRDGQEWQEVVSSTYQPFLDRHRINVDPSLHTNRVESIDPSAGWNPGWTLKKGRFRVLFLSNAVPAFVAAAIQGVRTAPGAIVLNCPEWHLSAFEAGTFDVIVNVDGADPIVSDILQSHRNAGSVLVYLAAYGAQKGSDPVAFDAPEMAANRHIETLFADQVPYFPQPGHGHRGSAADRALIQREASDLVVNATKSDIRDAIPLPDLPLPALAERHVSERRRIAYRLPTGASEVFASETIARLDAEGSDGASLSLTSLVISRAGADIVVSRDDIDALPIADRIGLGCLASRHDVNLVATDGSSIAAADLFDRSAQADDWEGWFANLIRLARIRRQLEIPPGRPIVVDVYLMSELYSGSEAYGLLLAKGLAKIGVRTRVRVPERNIYGGDVIAINDWLKENDLQRAMRAPYLPTRQHLHRPAAERDAAAERLDAFIRSDPPDLILASGYIPQLTELPERPPVFMAFFSAAAYDHTWLREMHGQLHGIMSDSEWALRPTAAVIGAPSRVIRSAVQGIGGAEIARVTAANLGAPVRIAVAGTLQPRKGQLEAVKAAALLRQRGYDVELNLYGLALDMMKDYIVTLDEAIRTEGMEAHVKRHGFVEDVNEITRDNHIVLCASTDESLPQGLVFHMYQGLVGVSALCGGVDEIISDGKTGYLTNDPSAAGLAAALARALDDRGRWLEITEAARRKIYHECGATSVTTGLLELLLDGLAVVGPTRLRRPEPIGGAVGPLQAPATAKEAIGHASRMVARGIVYRLKRYLGRSRHVRQLHGVLMRRMKAGRGDGT